MASKKPTTKGGMKRNSGSCPTSTFKKSRQDGLNLVEIPGSAILETHYEDIHLAYSPQREDAPLEFYIGPNETTYLDLNNTFLYLKLKVTDKDGNKLAETSTTTPAHHPFASAFKNLELQVFDTKVTSSTGHYPYECYVRRVLTNGQEA